MELLIATETLTGSLRDSTETIAAALITTSDGYFVLTRMSENAHNRIAGEVHLPGTGVSQYAEDKIPVALVRYLHGATGLEVTLKEIIAVTDRPGTSKDGGNRFVRHIWYKGSIDMTREEVRRLVANRRTAEREITHILTFDGCEAKASLEETKISHERTPIAIYHLLK